jgi:hypothetical protein
MSEEKFERVPLDYLKLIVKGLREAPRKSVNGGVLVAEILDDTCHAWAEFLSEMIDAAEQA